MAAVEKERGQNRSNADAVLPRAVASALSSAAVQEKSAAPAPKEHKKIKRTWGLWFFDAVLYGALHCTVFTISVVLTYFTNVGGKKIDDPSKPGEQMWRRYASGDKHLITNEILTPDSKEVGKLMHKGTGGAVGQFFFRRSDKALDVLRNRFPDMKPKNVENLKMVLFSFIDGTIVTLLSIPFQWLRTPVSRWLDDHLGRKFNEKKGLTPEDIENAYTQEPKQGGFSTFWGRIVTFAIVISTYFGLKSVQFSPPETTGKITTKLKNIFFHSGVVNAGDKHNLNDILFNSPGHALGDWMKSEPAPTDPSKNIVSRAIGNLLAKRKAVVEFFSKRNIVFEELTNVSIFETFYTGVCTLGVAWIGRAIAAFTGKKKDDKAVKETASGTSAPPETTASLSPEEPKTETGPRLAADRYKVPPAADTRAAAIQQQRDRVEVTASPAI